ncbi:MAG: ABC transporter ATP-binding protein [Burkholderiales bacterium]|nr:ABC transporter ATP-binding protein [Burkholderiales bacterium]
MSDEGSVSRAGLEARLAQPGPIPLAAELRCAPGEITALLGPSGSGKTTILRAIAGHYLPRSGRIAVGGRLWLDTEAGVNVAAHERRAGLVFQSYALFPHMTALENVAAALGHLPAGARAARAQELLQTVHLAGLEARRPAELSGGQQQRVAVARALAREPEVLLLDEPFSAVDRSTRERLYRELAEMRRRLAMPVLLVTHDLDEALMLADRVVLLHHGATIQHGAPYEVLARPASVEAARLLGLRNLFEGTVEGERDGFTILRWRGYLLEARRDARFSAGARVAWVIPSTRVVLHRRDRPSRGERENPVHGVIREALVLGDMTHATLLVDSDAHAPIQFSVPTHVAQRNRLEEGGPATVSLLAEGIHLMPLPETGT